MKSEGQALPKSTCLSLLSPGNWRCCIYPLSLPYLRGISASVDTTYNSVNMEPKAHNMIEKKKKKRDVLFSMTIHNNKMYVITMQLFFFLAALFTKKKKETTHKNIISSRVASSSIISKAVFSKVNLANTPQFLLIISFIIRQTQSSLSTFSFLTLSGLTGKS